MQAHSHKLTPQMTLGEVAHLAPHLISRFYEHNSDFSCCSNTSLKSICQEQQKTWPQFLKELTHPLSHPSEKPLLAYPEGDLPGLIEYILERFHAGHRHDFSYLTPMLAEVTRLHGNRDPNLAQLSQVWHHIIADVEPHMQKEEHVLFPLLNKLERFDAIEASRLMNPLMPMAVMRREHDTLGPLLGELTSLTDFFRPPSWADTVLITLYRGLAHFDQEIRLHIHLENNLLFPMAEALHASIEGNGITSNGCRL